MTIVYVAIGGALGAVLRYLVALAVTWPMGTLLVNVLGSFLIGLAFTLLTPERGLDRFAPFLMIGVLGGFTTYSTFSLDTLRLIEQGQTGAALAYAGGTLVACLAACALGLWLARVVLA